MAGADALDRLPDVVGGSQQGGRSLKQERPGLGQLDGMRRAMQELGLELGLEQPDLAAQRRLRDVQALRGAGEVAFLGDRDEVAETP
jgi:hypothetical protein